VLAYGFTENYQFGAKTDRNSVFPGRGPRIANRLPKTVPYFIFYGFWKISHFCSKSMGVSLRFYRKLPVWGKTDRNSVFPGRDPRIANQLPITVPYFIFYGFWKISHFCSKSMGVSLRFYRKLPVWGETDRNSIFLGREPRIVNRLSITVPHFNFYGFWKISHFCSKSMGVSQRFYRKLPVWGKNWPKLRISWSWHPYCESVIYNGPVFHFLRVFKNFPFLLEIHGC
jgi:hypothetical protein